MDEWVERVKKELAEALKMFGTHTFFDKGPHEVMDVGVFVEELRALPGDEAGRRLQALVDIGSREMRDVASAILGECDSMDEAWWTACCEAGPGVEY